MTADQQLREVQDLARHLYGAAIAEGSKTQPLEGVVHVVSSVRVPTDPLRLHVIAIDEHAPKSASDFFVLNFWRAHCDAILTTAQVARAEPGLSHALQGPLTRGLGAYRREVLGKTQPPWCAVLTRKADITPEHRMFDDALGYVMLTTPERAPALQSALGKRAETVGLQDLDVRRAVSFMRARGARLIMIEAGPSTAGQLYSTPAWVQHLMLSRFEGLIDPAAVGGPLPPDTVLFDGLRLLSDVSREESSGTWRFQHLCRSVRALEII